MIKIIGFDLDQTLYPKSEEVDTAIQQYLYEKIAEHKGCSVEEAETLFKTYYPHLSGSKALAKIGIPNGSELVQEALEKADIASFLAPNSEVLQLLKDLKEEYGNLSLLTGSNRKIMEEKLEKMNIPLELFDFITTADTHSKSNGEAYKAWLQFFQEKDPTLQPSQFLYIGDRKSTDVDVPLSLGMGAILVNGKKKEDVPVLQLDDVLKIRDVLLD